MSRKRQQKPKPEGIEAVAKESVLGQLRALWREAKTAAIEAETAKLHAENVVAQIEEFAGRVREGKLTPYEVLAILDPTHPEVDLWIEQVNRAYAEQALRDATDALDADEENPDRLVDLEARLHDAISLIKDPGVKQQYEAEMQRRLQHLPSKLIGGANAG